MKRDLRTIVVITLLAGLERRVAALETVLAAKAGAGSVTTAALVPPTAVAAE